MTGKARTILLFDAVSGVLGEAKRNCLLAAPGLDVSFSGTVTSFAPELLLLILWVRERLPHDGALEPLPLIGVADYAGLAARVLRTARCG
jgi:hypothetical protein